MRPRFEKDAAFETIPLESERLRLFREFLTAMEESCSHHHSKKKKKKDKKRRSRSKSSVSSLYSCAHARGFPVRTRSCTLCHVLHMVVLPHNVMHM